MKTEVLASIRRWVAHWRVNALVLGAAAVGGALALATGAVVNAVFIAPPFPGAERVALLQRVGAGGDLVDLNDADVEAAVADTGLPLAKMWRALPLERTPDAPRAAQVSTNFFDVVGVRAIVGRTLVPDDHGRADLAVLGERLWKTRFGGNEEIIGRPVLLGTKRLTVIGVVPEGFSLPLGAEVWSPGPAELMSYRAVVTLPVGVTADHVSERFSTWKARSIEDVLAPGDMSHAIVLVGCALLLLAATGAYFLLVHVGEASRRRGEVALRQALGAGRWQATRSIAVEAFVRLVLCGAMALLLAPAVLSWLVIRLPAELVVGRAIVLDIPLIAALIASLCVGAGATTAIWLRLTTQATRACQVGRVVNSGARWTRIAVAAQLAVVVPLVYLLGLAADGFHALAGRDLGMRTADVLSAEIPLWQGAATFEEATRHLVRLSSLLNRVSALTGVQDVALSSDRLGFRPSVATTRIRLAGRPDSDRIDVQQAVVSGAYFRLLDIEVVAGRTFDERVPTEIDWQDVHGGVVVDTTLAALLGRGEGVVGRTVVVGFTPTMIIGVVAPIKSRRPDEPVEPRLYLRLSPSAPLATNMLVRFSGPASPVAQRVAGAVQQEMNTVAPAATVLLADELARLVSPNRGMYEIALLLASVAGTLSVLGLFAVATYVLARRRKEAALRIAVGASSLNILRWCLRDIAWATPAGLALGLMVGVLLGRALELRLYGIVAVNPATIVQSTVVMAGMVGVGFALSVRRLLHSDVLAALRDE